MLQKHIPEIYEQHPLQLANDFTIFDSYVTTDKDNHLILVMIVDIKYCADSGSYINRVLFYENIKKNIPEFIILPVW